MPLSLRLESDKDILNLASVEQSGYGVQAVSGATGFGLPPVDWQYVEGAGNGSTPRGVRVLSRDMDIPLYIRAHDRKELRDYASRLAKILAQPARLVFVENAQESWYQIITRTGGGDWVYGNDTTGNLEARTVITVRAGDPFFTSNEQQLRVIQDGSTKGLLTGPLSALQVSSAQNIGTIDLDNSAGDAEAFPVWKIYGPGRDFKATSAAGEVLEWTGTVAAGKSVTIDTRSGTVVDSDGVNQYSKLATRPQFWSIPEGTTTATASLLDTTPGVSKIECTWRARRWVTI